jgi:hypothetical protein
MKERYADINIFRNRIEENKWQVEQNKQKKYMKFMQKNIV